MKSMSRGSSAASASAARAASIAIPMMLSGVSFQRPDSPTPMTAYFPLIVASGCHAAALAAFKRHSRGLSAPGLRRDPFGTQFPFEDAADRTTRHGIAKFDVR